MATTANLGPEVAATTAADQAPPETSTALADAPATTHEQTKPTETAPGAAANGDNHVVSDPTTAAAPDPDVHPQTGVPKPKREHTFQEKSALRGQQAKKKFSLCCGGKDDLQS